MEDIEVETTENGPEYDSADKISVISRLNPTETIADSQSFEDFPDCNVKIISVQKDGKKSEEKKKTGSSSGCKAQVAIDESSLNRSENETKSGPFSGCKAQVEIENSSFKRSISNMKNVQKEEWVPDTEVVADFHFRGLDNDDLPFNKGDIITIIHPTRDPNWYKGRNGNGREGMVPANYVSKRKEVQRKVVQLRAMAWFHGKIKREKAEELLEPWEDGLFLVRESVNYPGDFTLDVCHHGKVEHYRIIYVDNRMTIDERTYFDNLAQLVEHYTMDADGLCTRLLQPLQKQGSNFATVALHDFKSGGWVIDKRDLFIGEFIERGEFGDVCKGDFKGQQVAIKQPKKQDNAAQALLKEAVFMTFLQHHNLVQLIGVVLGDNIQLHVVTEFMGKGSLVEYLRSGRSAITKKDQIKFATDTCSAMQYLESKDFVHRDLAARNVLINDDNTAKKFTSKSDMWSFGILLWEIYSFGRVPYPAISIQDSVMYVERGYRMEAPEGCPKEIYDIMLKSWNIVADKRPTFKEVLDKLNHLRATTA